MPTCTALMGRRLLQAKFNAVYNTVTRSNNNEWLRRKLFEGTSAQNDPLRRSCEVIPLACRMGARK